MLRCIIGGETEIGSKPSMALCLFLLDDNAEPAGAGRAGLLAAGCEVVGHAVSSDDLTGQVRQSKADVIVCAIDSPSRDVIESMQALNRDEPRPVVMFVDRADPATPAHGAWWLSRRRAWGHVPPDADATIVGRIWRTDLWRSAAALAGEPAPISDIASPPPGGFAP